MPGPCDRGDLAVVDDCYLMQQLWNHILETYGKISHWLGATDQHHEGTWVWVDGTPVAMGTPFWPYYQPDIDNEDQHCLQFHASWNGYFDDTNCTLSYPFVCHLKPPPRLTFIFTTFFPCSVPKMTLCSCI